MVNDSTRHQQSRWINSLIRPRMRRSAVGDSASLSNFILAIPVSCLIISLCAFGWLQVETEKAQYLVQHTQQVRLKTKRLLTELLNAETNVRGYEITRNQEFKASYEAARTEIPNDLAEIEQLVHDNPAQTRQFQQIRSLMQSRLTRLQDVVQIIKTEPKEFTHSPEITSRLIEGKRVMDQTIAEIERFLAEEEQLQQQRDALLRQKQQLTWWVLGLSAGIGIVGAVGAAYLLNHLKRKVTERDRILHESEARYRLLIENFPNGAVVLFNSELRYLIANGEAIVKSGLSREQLLEKTIWEALPPETANVLEPIYRDALAGIAATSEIPFGERIYLLHTLPMRDERGEIVGGMAVSQDITESKQAEQQLKESEERYRQLLELCPDGILIETQGTFKLVNRAAMQLFGATKQEELMGKPVVELMHKLLHPEYHEIVAERMRHLQNGGSAVTQIEEKWFRLDGTLFYAEVSAIAFTYNQERGIQVVMRDITERKLAEIEIRRLNQSLEHRAKESETRYKQIVELAEEGIWVIDHEAKTTYVNQAMAKMLGYTEQEMMGHPFFEFMDQTEYQTAISNLERRKKGMPEKHEFRLKTKDGKDLWTYMSTSPVLDENGKMLWACALVYDITARKQSEEQLQQSNERISLANAELARAARLKDEFLASMSHELRTPLNAILGLSEALKEEVYGPLTNKQHKSLTTIEDSGKHLLELINDILDLSKIESGKMELQFSPISLQYLCDSSLTFVKQLAQRKSIKLRSKITEGIGKIELDERRIRQVLINLLSNAVKFTPNGGEIYLEIAADAEDEVIRLSVTDTGIGIAPENLNQLFKPFIQLDSSLSRRYSGTGLGLALVRRIVELHGGSISVESEVGQFSQFTITLPWKKLQPMEQSSIEIEQALLELPNIQQALIVEDSETAAKQVKRYLTELGTVAHIHPCGDGTVEAAQNVNPDVIILDILLPDRSGWQVLQDLKANPATQNIPVLVISVVDERLHALSLGASEYLVKPISRQQLHSTLGKIFANAAHNFGNTALVVTPKSKRELPLILLAEDNESNIATLMDYLQVHKFRVSLARNGIEAVQMAKQQIPDLILMDIQMPEMDGLEATRRIRSEPDFATIPIIALTALAMPGDRERCLAAGATDYLTKPIGLKMLAKIITQYINR